MSDNKTIKFELVTPERLVFSGDIFQVTLPTKMGEITVLPGHIPLISVLVPGVAMLKQASGEIKYLSVSGGFIEVSADKIVILADTAEMAEEIDEARVLEAHKQAQELMINTKSDQVDYQQYRLDFMKEMARVKTLEKWRKIK